MNDNIPRLASRASGSSDVVRSVLASASSAKIHGPTPEELRGLTSRLAAALPAGAIGGAAGGAGGASGVGGASRAAVGGKGALIAKAVMAVAALALVSAGVWTATRPGSSRSAAFSGEDPTAARRVTPTSPPGPPPATPSVSELAALPSALPASSTRPASTGLTSSRSSTAGAVPSSEPEAVMLSRAHDALLRGAAESALAITRAHSQAYPHGALAQEREMIAIEAQLKSGDEAAARARAAAFRRSYPGSSHLERLDALLAR